jgi:predicted NAD/FAD-dependent oxidoreductase
MPARKTSSRTPQQRFAIVGAGMAGVVCARTLCQAGHDVTLFEKSRGVGGRMATRHSVFGSFDHGVQYFTVRDSRFAKALQTVPALCKPWSANTVRMLDAKGHALALAPTSHSPRTHWVATPHMSALCQAWAQPLLTAQQLQLQTRIQHIARDASGQWQLHGVGANGATKVFAGFDGVILAMPSVQARDLLQSAKLAKDWVKQLDTQVQVMPCWTLMLAFPQAMQPNLNALGPQWNAARSAHPRAAWLARESSKPGRGVIERWTVQASSAWSQEHLEDEAWRVQSKMHKAFSEITGIRAQPAHLETHRWRYAQTTQALGISHLWDAQKNLGLCGDWCLGHRLEDAFLSGLALGYCAL